MKKLKKVAVFLIEVVHAKANFNDDVESAERFMGHYLIL
jgi:hypothetical protein